MGHAADSQTSHGGVGRARLRNRRQKINKFENGVVPENMDDKWLCYSSPRDAHGVAFVHFCLSWSRTEQMVLTLQPAADGAEGMQEAGAS